MRLFNITNVQIQNNHLRVCVEPTPFFQTNVFFISCSNFTKFIKETLSIDNTAEGYFVGNSLETIIDGIYCYLIFNNEIIVNDKKETA